jgi:hypothetical protein
MERAEIKVHHHYRTSKPVWGSARVQVDSVTATAVDDEGEYVGVKVEYMDERAGWQVTASSGRVVRPETILHLWNLKPYPYRVGMQVVMRGVEPYYGTVTDILGGHWDSPIRVRFDLYNDDDQSVDLRDVSPVMPLLDAVRLVAQDQTMAYPELSLASAVAHARNVITPEDVDSDYAGDDETAAAYRAVLSASEDELTATYEHHAATVIADASSVVPPELVGDLVDSAMMRTGLGHAADNLGTVDRVSLLAEQLIREAAAARPPVE